MVWFKSDDGFWRHRKVRKLGKDKVLAAGVWQLSGCWCADNLTDGFIPSEQVEVWDPRLRIAERLVEVGLWMKAVEDGEEGYRFHDWSEYQPTKEKVESDRRAWRDRKAKSRDKSRQESRRDTPGESPQGSDVESARPVPSRPVPVPSGGSFRGEGYVPARASEPPSKCKKHRDDPNPPACGPCADARREFEQWEKAERFAIRACPLCTTDGQRIQPGTRSIPMSPYVKCDHKPLPRQETA